jgi:general secretion pathway protein D
MKKLIIIFFIFINSHALASNLTDPDVAFDKTTVVNFQNAEIEIFIKYIGKQTGVTFVLDKSVTGYITVLSSSPLVQTELHGLLVTVLRLHGYSIVGTGKVLSIVPTEKGKLYDTMVNSDLESNDNIATKFFTLEYACADEVKTSLLSLLPETTLIAIHEDSGSVIVTDYISNLDRISKIIKTVDVPFASNVKVFTIKNGDSSKIANALVEIFDKGSFVSIDRLNSIVVSASADELKNIATVLTSIDSPQQRYKKETNVIFLNHVDATALSDVLTQLHAENKNITFVPDVFSNSILINCPNNELYALSKVIQKIDNPRSMVYVEALIVEVTTKNDLDIGFNYIATMQNLNTGFTGNLVPENFFLKLFRNSSDASFTVPNISLMIKAFRKNSNIRVISNPQIVTIDNKTARISVGENIPYLMRSEESPSGAGYRNYEYKDVGTSLTILPKIRTNNTVRLDLSVIVNKMDISRSGNALPVTFKRELETSVSVGSGQTLVLGGVIGVESSRTDFKIPLLGDIPILGKIFRSTSESKIETNLFIFLTPHIIKKDSEITDIYREKKSNISIGRGFFSRSDSE